MPVGVKHVHEAVAASGHVIVLCAVLKGIGYVQLPIDVADAKWGVADRSVGVGEGSRHVDGREILVENIDCRGAEVRCVEEIVTVIRRGKFETLVYRSVRRGRIRRVINLQDCVGQIYRGAPPGDRSILSRKDERGFAGMPALGDHEIRSR